MNLGTQEDHQLVALYRSGNEQALNVLIRRHQERVFGQILAKVQDSLVADDLFQETFIKVIRSLKSTTYNEEGKFLPWVLRVANNATMDYFRREKRSKEINSQGEFTVFDTYGELDRSIEEDLVNHQIHQDLHALIAQLPSDQRQVVELRMFCNYSFKEIAEETNVSINTALGRMRYAVKNIQRMMNEHGISLQA